MCTAEKTLQTLRLALDLNDQFCRDGTVLSEDNLRRALGFGSVEAMTKAMARQKLPLPFFRMPNRRGRFCLAREVACFIAIHRVATGHVSEVGASEKEGIDMS